MKTTKTGNTMSRDELFGDYVAMLEHARQCARRIPLNGEETSPDQADIIENFLSPPGLV